MLTPIHALLLLLDVSAKVVLLAVLAALALALFRVRNDHVRHQVWTFVLLGMLCMPLLSQVVPQLAIPILTHVDGPAAATSVIPDGEPPRTAPISELWQDRSALRAPFDTPPATTENAHALPDVASHDALLAPIPGEGIIGVRIDDPRHLLGVGAESLAHLKHETEDRFLTYDYCSSRWHHVLALVGIEEGQKEIEVNLQARRGGALEFAVVDPDGNPLTDYTINNHRDRKATANRSTIYGFEEAKTRTIYFEHRDKRLAKAVTIIGMPKDQGVRTLVLEPYGTVTGRLVNKDGLPAVGGMIVPEREPIAGPPEAPNPAMSLSFWRTPWTKTVDLRSRSWYQAPITPSMPRRFLTCAASSSGKDWRLNLAKSWIWA